MGVEFLDENSEVPELFKNRPVTIFMYEVWKTRPDLQQAFDIFSYDGQAAFLHWYEITDEYNKIKKQTTISSRREPADINQLSKSGFISNELYSIYVARDDLQKCFDINTLDGQNGLINWFVSSAKSEYKISPSYVKGNRNGSLKRVKIAIVEKLKTVLLHVFRRSLKHRQKIYLKALLARNLVRVSKIKSQLIKVDRNIEVENKSVNHQGVSLIGYLNAELGMGEHVRMTAEALSCVKQEFSVLDMNVGVSSRQKASHKFVASSDYNNYLNLFHVNADAMLIAYTHFGKDFFVEKYNVGYWAWELSKCPDEWQIPIRMVDEIWAPSKFIQDAFSESKSTKVRLMPLCVEIPQFEKMKRSTFSLNDDVFYFYFAFDAFSYMERKNPAAIIDAFTMAFPKGSEPVGLVFKIMNGKDNIRGWRSFCEKAKKDRRIKIINETLDREVLLSLFDCCDCFISLHRSEGFGRGLAEAMLLKKPVICTGYSGNMDFTDDATAYIVEYSLVKVLEGQYPFSKNQFWAEPSVANAAEKMKLVFSDEMLRQQKVISAYSKIKKDFSRERIGSLYRARIQEILESYNERM